MLRWVHLILGGALLMPYWLLGSVFVGPLAGADGMFTNSLTVQFGSYAVALPLAAVTALFPLTRPMSVAAARLLCGVPPDRFAEGPAKSRAAKVRTAGWFTLHLGLGGLISGASLALPPFAVTTMLLPFSAALRHWVRAPAWLDRPWVLALAPVAGIAMLVALAACAAGAGALLARQAPVLLGPTPADRLAAAERRAAELAQRNRLARELHDSVGHALSAVTLQASAARRVLDRDPAFVREALTAIEETTRRTLGELDTVLGLLRQEDESDRAAGPTLEDLDTLLRHSGLAVSCTVRGDPAEAPEPLSRDAYRIVQEGLSNALRHGGAPPVSLLISMEDGELRILMENPVPAGAPVLRPGGGRGVRGIAERAVLLGGHAEAGPVDGHWRLSARLPLRGGAPGGGQ